MKIALKIYEDSNIDYLLSFGDKDKIKACVISLLREAYFNGAVDGGMDSSVFREALNHYEANVQ